MQQLCSVAPDGFRLKFFRVLHRQKVITPDLKKPVVKTRQVIPPSSLNCSWHLSKAYIPSLKIYAVYCSINQSCHVNCCSMHFLHLWTLCSQRYKQHSAILKKLITKRHLSRQEKRDMAQLFIKKIMHLLENEKSSLTLLICSASLYSKSCLFA